MTGVIIFEQTEISSCNMHGAHKIALLQRVNFFHLTFLPRSIFASIAKKKRKKEEEIEAFDSKIFCVMTDQHVFWLIWECVPLKQNAPEILHNTTFLTLIKQMLKICKVRWCNNRKWSIKHFDFHQKPIKNVSSECNCKKKKKKRPWQNFETCHASFTFINFFPCCVAVLLSVIVPYVSCYDMGADVNIAICKLNSSG